MFRGFALTVLLLGVISLIAGCGQGEYDSRMAGALGASARRAKQAEQNQLVPEFFSTVGANPFAQTVKLKYPAGFRTRGFTSINGVPRAWFTPAALPGQGLTLEMQLPDDAGKQLPASLYTLCVESDKTPRDQMLTAIQTPVATIDPAAAWVDAQVGSFAGKRLEAKGNMEFEFASGTKETLPGKLLLFWLENGTTQSVIGFRAPDAVAAKHQFFEEAEAAIATVQAEK